MNGRKVFEVNVFGCFASTRAVADRMQAKGIKGSIVLITSTNGINSHSSISAHYDSSKAAQGHMMKILAEEYASAGIRINGVAPGWIDTSLNDTLPEDERTKEMAKIWSGRFAEPHEIAVFVAFILRHGRSLYLRSEFHGRWRLPLAHPLCVFQKSFLRSTFFCKTVALLATFLYYGFLLITHTRGRFIF